MKNRKLGWKASAMAMVAFGATQLGCSASDGAESESTGASAEALAAGTPLVGVESGRCLDVQHNSTTPGTPLQIYACNGGKNQAFTFTAAGELRVFDGALCVQAAGTSAGAGLSIQNCNGQLNQQWRLNANKTITAAQSQLCLDVNGRQTADRSPVEVWTCNGQTNQQWSSTAADTQPPTPPSGLSTSNVTCNSATLSWSASTDNVGVAFYDVFHDGQLMKTVDGGTRSTSLTVVAGVTWGLYINARDAAGNVSQASATLPLTPPQCQVDNQPPTAPTALTGSVAGTSVTLNWSAASDNIGVRAYDIYRGGAQVGSVVGTATVPPVTTFMDSALAANTAYSYSWSRAMRKATSRRTAAASTSRPGRLAACARPAK
jgi:chitodextrinase